jgi:sulfate/thiosulfate transport system ATP-binding protein
VAIDVRHVHKTFANYTALKGVSLKVNDGELIALLGPSGSGKTTLLRIIAGLDAPDPGDQTAVLVDGQDISRQSNGQPRVGFVFQHYALFRHMTVFENVAFGLRVRPRKLRPNDTEIRRRVDELLDLIQLNRWAGHYPSQLSGGQRQRVALARALAIEPSVLLLDEPFGALDEVTRAQMQHLLLKIVRDFQTAAVLITHDIDEALLVSDRVVLLGRSPARQIGEWRIDLPKPREDYVSELGAIRVEIVSALRAAMRAH